MSLDKPRAPALYASMYDPKYLEQKREAIKQASSFTDKDVKELPSSAYHFIAATLSYRCTVLMRGTHFVRLNNIGRQAVELSPSLMMFYNTKDYVTGYRYARLVQALLDSCGSQVNMAEKVSELLVDAPRFIKMKTEQEIRAAMPQDLAPLFDSAFEAINSLTMSPPSLADDTVSRFVDRFPEGARKLGDIAKGRRNGFASLIADMVFMGSFLQHERTNKFAAVLAPGAVLVVVHLETKKYKEVLIEHDSRYEVVDLSERGYADVVFISYGQSLSVVAESSRVCLTPEQPMITISGLSGIARFHELGKPYSPPLFKSDLDAVTKEVLLKPLQSICLVLVEEWGKVGFGLQTPPLPILEIALDYCWRFGVDEPVLWTILAGRLAELKESPSALASFCIVTLELSRLGADVTPLIGSVYRELVAGAQKEMARPELYETSFLFLYLIGMRLKGSDSGQFKEYLTELAVPTASEDMLASLRQGLNFIPTGEKTDPTVLSLYGRCVKQTSGSPDPRVTLDGSSVVKATQTLSLRIISLCRRVLPRVWGGKFVENLFALGDDFANVLGVLGTTGESTVEFVGHLTAARRAAGSLVDPKKLNPCLLVIQGRIMRLQVSIDDLVAKIVQVDTLEEFSGSRRTSSCFADAFAIVRAELDLLCRFQVAPAEAVSRAELLMNLSTRVVGNLAEGLSKRVKQEPGMSVRSLCIVVNDIASLRPMWNEFIASVNKIIPGMERKPTDDTKYGAFLDEVFGALGTRVKNEFTPFWTDKFWLVKKFGLISSEKWQAYAPRVDDVADKIREICEEAKEVLLPPQVPKLIFAIVRALEMSICEALYLGAENVIPGFIQWMEGVQAMLTDVDDSIAEVLGRDAVDGAKGMLFSEVRPLLVMMDVAGNAKASTQGLDSKLAAVAVKQRKK